MEDRARRLEGRTDLLGRSSECAVLDGVIVDVARDKSRALVLQGEAGVGKTALLEYLIAEASKMAIARAVGVESEMELAYGGVHQLCAPFLDWRTRLPGPQREALEVVFGLSRGEAPDRFLVGLAVLSLLAEASEERPLLCVVDDAQWLDQSSLLTLAFVARRLLAEPVGLVFAVREAEDPLRHLPKLEIGGLRNGDASRLLTSTVRVKLDERVRDRIIAETRGNPLALLELPRGLNAGERAGFGAGGVSPVANGVEESFRRRILGLPAEAQRLLLIAAAEPLGDSVLVWRAAALRGVNAEAADAAVAEGLCEFGARVRFRHPLVRSAAYRAGSLEDRRQAHASIAAVTDG
ncbi:MAG: AAA family ATPase, partial [Solirubrobacterales bacterium]|nr:AAA family ATPase [Solirubrobacterales bacterium]